MKQLSIIIILITLFSVSCAGVKSSKIPDSTLFPAQATGSAGANGVAAISSVLKLYCSSTKTSGTGFLHKSGYVITANHNMRNCKSSDVLLITSDKKRYRVKSIKGNSNYDLAILKPSININAQTLEISFQTDFTTGMPVSIWGYPYGYPSSNPLLITGTLSGTTHLERRYNCSKSNKPCKSSKHWVLNAAVNIGNSGSPVLNQKDGKIIGVVVTKFSPIPKDIKAAIKALKSKDPRNPDNTSKEELEELSEAQLTGKVLAHLNMQTQLVIGMAVTNSDLIKFLQLYKIDP